MREDRGPHRAMDLVAVASPGNAFAGRPFSPIRCRTASIERGSSVLWYAGPKALPHRPYCTVIVNDLSGITMYLDNASFAFNTRHPSSDCLHCSTQVDSTTATVLY